MVHLNETQRIEILILIGCGDKTRSQEEVCNLFRTKYPERPITRSTVSKIEKKFRETGNVKDRLRPGRPKISENTKLNILLEVQDNPHSASTEIALNNDVSRRSVLRVLKQEKYHPYKIRLLHELNEDDPDRRLQFCETMMEICNLNQVFHRNILFSDEATFCLNGSVNRQNFRYWSTNNPRWMREQHTQNPQKVNVWAGILNDRIIGPFFFDGNLTGDQYLQFLQNELIPTLAANFPNINQPNLPEASIWFQQDGAPPHFARQVREYLNTVFPERWIGRRGPIEWPARSPDLTPMDFFLWGYLKSKVYKDKPQNLEDLKFKIRYEIRHINENTINNVLEGFLSRLAYCQEVNGWHFQHLIK